MPCLKVYFSLIIICLSNSLFNCIWQESEFPSSFNLSVLKNVFCENIIVLNLFWFFPTWLLFWKYLLYCKSSLFLVFEINGILELASTILLFNFYFSLLFHASLILLPRLSVLFFLWSSFWIDWGYVYVRTTFPFITFTSLEIKAP